MKHLLTFLLSALPVAGLHAQIDTVKSAYGSYRFDGDDVVFEFDLRLYAQARLSADSTAVDFLDLGIYEVAVSGAFNHWSAEGWKMQRIDPYRFRLRKPLQEFKDAPDWQFRFLINGTHGTPRDSLLKKQGVLGWYDLRNADAHPIAFGDTGNVVFRLHGFTKAQRVILTGNFNQWNEEAIAMQRRADGWEIHVTLPPGEYEYKFIADGHWLHDPANPEKRTNQYGTFNSVLRLAHPVAFKLEGFTDARAVYLAGSFNEWKPDRLAMQRTSGGWAISVPLVPGKHLYKFIVDGQWITDPANRRVEVDWHGNVNSVLLVRSQQ